MAASVPGIPEFVDVSDGKATYRVKSNGDIEVLTNEWGNQGKVFKPGKGTYDQVVKNLAYFGSNAGQLAAVLGPIQWSTSMTSPAVKTPTGTGATMQDISEGNVDLAFYQKEWFLPVAVGAGALLLGSLIVFWPKR